jgi:DNA-binding Lrp family transcriptional regulator
MNAEIKLGTGLDIDGDDRKILSLVQNNVNITQAEIATVINKIQPAVGARLLKLERKRLLSTQYGINMSANKIPMAIVRMYAKHSKQVLASIDCCPHVLNAFTTLGRTNITVILAGASIERLEDIVEKHFRSNPEIKHVEMAVVMEPVTDTILPMDLDLDETLPCGKECHEKADARHKTAASGKKSTGIGGKIDAILDIDADDRQIITKLQDDPEVTQEEIGELIGKSQPAVGSRIAKLVKNKTIAVRKGVNLKAVKDLRLVQASIATRDAAGVVKKLRACNMISLGFRIVSEASLIVFIGGKSLDDIETIIDACLRADDRVRSVETIPIISYLKDLILPFNFECDFIEGVGCPGCTYCTPRVAIKSIPRVPLATDTQVRVAAVSEPERQVTASRSQATHALTAK